MTLEFRRQFRRVVTASADELEYRERSFNLTRLIVGGASFGFVAYFIWHLVEYYETHPISHGSELVGQVFVFILILIVPFFFGLASLQLGRVKINRRTHEISVWEVGSFPSKPIKYDISKFQECIVTAEEVGDRDYDDSKPSYWHSVRVLLPEKDAILFATADQDHAEKIAAEINAFLTFPN